MNATGQFPGDPLPPADLHRRHFLARGMIAAATLPGAALAAAPATRTVPARTTEPFWGVHQGGIVTAPQQHTYFIAFDVVSTKRSDLIRLLQAWTDAAASMAGSAAQFDPQANPDQVQPQSGAAVGLSAARLTLTFGFGPTLFDKQGRNRFALAHQRPAPLVELPRFAGDQLVPEHTGGDLSVQACADDPQVVESAVRRLAKLAEGIATMRWAQTGFTGNVDPAHTPRNQMGFKDGTMNLPAGNTAAMNQFVWVGAEGPAWLRHGSYMVIRPIRISVEHWDDMKTSFQEETVGRRKMSGAPLGKQQEFDVLDLDAVQPDGNPVVAENAHAAMAAPQSNDGAQILRRTFSYDNGIARVAERWPPWKQVMTFDAGLLFQCYQRNPATGFTKIFTKMAQIDMLNQFTTHVGSGLFACPPGALPGEYIGQKLFA